MKNDTVVYVILEEVPGFNEWDIFGIYKSLAKAVEEVDYITSINGRPKWKYRIEEYLLHD